MNRILILVSLTILSLAGVAARGQEEQYVQIYNLIQDADASATSDAPIPALNKYLRAQSELQKFQKVYPEWNGRIVNFRLNYLAAKIADLSARKPAVVPSTPAATIKPAPTPPRNQTQPASDIQAQLNMLREQIGQLQSDNSLLQAKVREAFSAQPAAVDPRELAKANDKVKSVTKENELLKITLTQEKAAKAAADPREVERLRQQLADASRAAADQTGRANTLAQEKLALQNQLLTLSQSGKSSPESDAVKKSLGDANRRLNEQLQLNTQLQSEKSALQARVTSLSVDAEAADALRAENLLLKKQLTDLKLTAASSKNDDATRKLAQAQAQIAALQSDKEMLRLEKVSLQQQVKQLTLANVSIARAGASPESAARIKQLERDRDDLQKKLNVAQTELVARNNRSSASQVEDLRGQLEVLRTRIAVYQAPAVPYAADELALFNKPEQMAVATSPGFEKKSAKELPPGTLSLVNEAQRDFALGRYEDAEKKYLQVLKQDEKNVYTLANLAAIQLELSHLDEAEKHVQQALALTPEDPYSLSILGNLKFRQGKFDDALDALAHAAKLDPKNAEVQNHLGLVLSQKGLRREAETALRKAVELDPNYAGAHNNLAVIYITQKPPAPALAKWHYQKARDLGMPANAQLEKMMENAAATQP